MELLAPKTAEARDPLTVWAIPRSVLKFSDYMNINARSLLHIFSSITPYLRNGTSHHQSYYRARHEWMVWARELCRISSPRFLAKCCMRRLNQGSFVVLLYFALFALFWVCLVFEVSLICLMSCIFQHVPTW